MRSTLSLVRIFALVALTACQGYGPTTPGGSSGSAGGGGGGGGTGTGVTVGDNFYSPATPVIAAGQTLTFTVTGLNQHTVTFADGVGSSGTLNTGNTLSRTFPVPGSFPFSCTIHTQMTGVVTVQ